MVFVGGRRRGARGRVRARSDAMFIGIMNSSTDVQYNSDDSSADRCGFAYAHLMLIGVR